jgi:hypothetical protein
MKRQFREFGGDRPLFTLTPVQVVGGFTLDPAQTNLTKGAVIPAGTLSRVDENSRLALLIKSARVVAIAAGDAKVVTLESDEFSKPIFTINDLIGKDLTATLANTPKITAITETADGMQITLSKAITGLAVGDALFEVVADGTNVKLLAEPNSITITDIEVKEAGDTGIDVTRNTGNGEAYARRLPPVPASLLDGNVLKGTKVAYTYSL